MEQWREVRKSYAATDSYGLYDNAYETIEKLRKLSDRLGRKLT